MTLVRNLVLAASCLFALPAAAQLGCVPNPNLTPQSNTPPGYVNGCPMPASVFNALSPQSMSANSNLLGAIAVDGGAVTATNNASGGPFGLGGGYSAQQIYEWAIGPGSTPAPSWDAVRGVGVHNSSSTDLDVNGTAGYVVNLNAHNGSAQVSSALKGIGVCAVNNCSTWGLDTILTDNEGQTLSSGTGRNLYNETDYNVTSPNTTIGFLIGGTWLAQPTSATGPTVLKPSGTGQWQYAFGTGNGATPNAFHVGASATSGTNVSSQNIEFDFFDAGGAAKLTDMVVGPGGITFASSSSAGGATSLSLQGTNTVVAVGTNGGLRVNSNDIASADSGANAFLCAVAGSSTCQIGSGGANTTVSFHGNLIGLGSASSISSGFGTSPAIVGNSNVGRVTLGNPVAQSGVVNLGFTYSAAPICFAQDETTAAGNPVRATPTTSQLTINASAAVAADKISYWCIGYQ